MEERASSSVLGSERYISLVTQWGTKLTEAIQKLRHQEDLISTLKREKFVLSEKLTASEASVREQFDEERAAILVRHQEEEEKLRNDHNKQISSLQQKLSQLKNENGELHEKLIHFQNLASNKGEEMSLFQTQKQEDEEKLQKYYKKKISLLQMQLRLAEAKASSSNLELSSLKLQVGQLDKKVESLGSELIKTKKGKTDAETELLQRMKSEMDKLDETFATLDSHTDDDETVAEQAPILESELEAMKEIPCQSSCHALPSNSGQLMEDYEDIVEIESIATSESTHESSWSLDLSSHEHEPIPSTSKSGTINIYEEIDSDADVTFLCETPEKTSTQTQNGTEDFQSNVENQNGDHHAVYTSNIGDKYFHCSCGKKFAKKGPLGTHLRYHKDKKFCCRLCITKFHRFSVWRKHMRVKHNNNTDENFGCSDCGVTFTTKSQYHQHRRENQ